MQSLTRNQIRLGIESFRSSKLRNFWTMSGIIIGVASVILVVGISEGVKHQISDQINRYGSNVITIQPSTVHVAGSSYYNIALLSGVNISGSLTSNDLQTVASTKGVKYAVPLSGMIAKVKGNTKATYQNGLVIGTNPNFLSAINQTMQYGQFLTDNDTLNNGVVIGYQTAIDLFDEDVPLGLPVTINGQQYTVRGVLNQFPATPLSNTAQFNKAVIITYANAQALTNGTITTYQILAKPKNTNQTDTIATNINNNLLNKHGGQSDFVVLNPSQAVAGNNAILDQITKLIFGLAAISLIVGGIGIMNVMLVSVSERMHEIGIRKAIGANNRQILNQFIIEATTLSVIGGIIGIILAFLIDGLLVLVTNLRPVISWQIVLISFFASIVVGIIFGTFPALKASSKDPIEALRLQ